MKHALLALLGLFSCALAARPEILDRIAIVVGHEVITEQQLDEEIRVTAFLNHEPVKRDLQARRSAAQRLVQQLLVRHDMELSRYPAPGSTDVNTYFDRVRETYGSGAAFRQALAADDLTETILKEHLAAQLVTLRFIEYRFRPDVDISEAEIENDYRRQSANWQSSHPGKTPPTLAASREGIRSALMEQRTDEMLDRWLGESRKQMDIVYLDKSLQ